MEKQSDSDTNETKSNNELGWLTGWLGGDDKPKFYPDEEKDEKVDRYLQCRLKNFVNFFDSVRAKNRHKERFLTYVIIVIGASISFVNVFTAVNWPGAQLVVAITSAGLGAVVTILTSIIQFERYRQDWINHKVAATQLRRQYYLWKARADQYCCDCKDTEKKCQAGQEKCKAIDYKFNTLVNNCEDIILREAIEYANLYRADREHPDGGAIQTRQ
jgi:hypothetical protein